MKLSKTSLLGVSITTSPKEEILSDMRKKLSALRPPFSVISIVTPNPEQIVLAQKNEHFRRILNEADIALPDGMGVVWAINRRQKAEDRGQRTEDRKRKTENGKRKIQNRPLSSVTRISGVDCMVDLCRLAAENHWKVLLVGGRGGVAGRALSSLQKRYPGLQGFAEEGPEIEKSKIKSQKSKIDGDIYILSIRSRLAGEKSPVVDGYIQNLVRMIQKEKIQLVFIGLGAPKQEYVMERLSLMLRVHGSLKKQKRTSMNDEQRTTNPLVFMSVGGAFDMLAGNVKRAPKVVQQCGFEWLWRLFQEPWRFRRQTSLLTFFRMVLFSKN